MKSTLWYQWEDEDLPVDFLREACTRLQTFYRDEDVPLHKSVKRVLDGNFTLTDVQHTAKLLENLASRAEAKWTGPMVESREVEIMRESMLLAVKNARNAVERLWNIFRGTP